MATILIAEDDRRVRESVGRALRLEGYEVLTAPDGAAALELVAREAPDLVLLDISMPNVDGLTVCRRLRERGDTTPVVMLTARHEVPDRVAGLDAGADDYLVKPFALEELLARVRARLRHVDGDDDGAVVRLGDLVVDVAGRRAERAGRPIALSRTEFDLLELLVRNAGVVLERGVIYERVWGDELDVESKTLDVYIGYLRRKTEAGDEPRLIHTVRGVGYVARLEDPVDPGAIREDGGPGGGGRR